MAKQDEKQGKSKKAEGNGKAPSAPAPTPRLLERYMTVARQKLMQEFQLTNVHQAPTLEKIVLNVGMGEAPKNAKLLDAAVAELAAITGQRPVITRAKKAISNFSLRAGMAIGTSVTLRRARMWEFLDRFVSLSIPRIRDFRGLPSKSFDGRGNYTVGIKEQMVFPEVDYDRIEKIHGMDITFVTSADRDDIAKALLRELGMPFQGDVPVII
ncbi:MAG: 50S ribosomal protein L5 [Gemmatimonadetes bacterium]|nr:50S ribosomal protein L5 [Gemmatimonadota bacterium]